MAIVSQFKKGTLELCCLHLIHEKTAMVMN
ncbi:Uncharacterised protein [Listeria grayi]|uniref:Uncharacterized protein n=1 Tax=Listeria grayi TaxID=1641 RepID=A0A378MJ19_LISGR|nr:Uncharacterised protein [Listeria grayi]